MKRRSQTSNLPCTPLHKSQTKIQSHTIHKSKYPKNVSSQLSKNGHNNKAKKNKSHEDQPVQDYIIIDGNVFQANTETERKEVNCFVNRFKRQAIYEKSIRCGAKVKKNGYGNRIQQEIGQAEDEGKGTEIEELVRNLPIEQKLSLMRQLEKQFNNNPEYLAQSSLNNSHTNDFNNTNNSRFSEAFRDTQHLQQKNQHQYQYQYQRQQQKKVGQQKESEKKYNLLSLKLQGFEKQLEQKRETQIQKINKLFYEGQLTASQRKSKIAGIDKVRDRKTKIINCTRNLFYTLLHNKFEPEYFKNSNIDEAIKELDSFSELENEAAGENNGDRLEYTKMQGESSMQSQVEFQKMEELKISIGIGRGSQKDKYDHIDQRAEGSDKKSVNEESLLISPDKSADKADREREFFGEKQKESQKQKQKQKQNNINFQCSQQTVSIARKLQIPLLLTKQKIQELEWQRKAKAVQKMRTEIDRKISFQMSQLQLDIEESKNHFTTLADINGYIMALYEYIIKKDLDHVVSRLNMPYGKATRDKLFLLQQNGDIDDLEYYSVLDESHLNGFNMETALTVRRFSDHEKIHNKAVFDSFNLHLNAYRPYYELDGDVYPWFVSEKGLTFYQINEENIEEVFEKTKIKVLQECSTLCGVIPFGINANQAPQIIKQKNNDNFQKQEKLSLVQNFPKWGIKLMDYETMVRLLITEEILIQQIQDFAQQLRSF